MHVLASPWGAGRVRGAVSFLLVFTELPVVVINVCMVSEFTGTKADLCYFCSGGVIFLKLEKEFR